MYGGYQSRTTDCTSHYIRESVLDEIVLWNLRQVTEFARELTEEFYAMEPPTAKLKPRGFIKRQKEKNSRLKSVSRSLTISSDAYTRIESAEESLPNVTIQWQVDTSKSKAH